MRNIGIMGGTFDPVHVGHLLVAEQARERMELDEVWFIPSNQPPHKNSSPIAGPFERLEMVRRAIDGHADFRLCDIEFERGGTSYSVETASLLKKRHPDCRFHWIIGSDMVRYLPKWYKIKELADQVSFVGLKRPGYPSVEGELPDWLRSSVTMIEMLQLDISSTDIRNRLSEGRSARYLVPDPVLSYIRESRLYESR